MPLLIVPWKEGQQIRAVEWICRLSAQKREDTLRTDRSAQRVQPNNA